MHPTTFGPPNYSRGIHFQPCIWKPRSLPLREIGAGWLVQGVRLQNEVVVFRSPLILVMPITGLNTDLDQLADEATPWWQHRSHLCSNTRWTQNWNNHCVIMDRHELMVGLNWGDRIGIRIGSLSQWAEPAAPEFQTITSSVQLGTINPKSSSGKFLSISPWRTCILWLEIGV